MRDIADAALSGDLIDDNQALALAGAPICKL